MNPNRAEENLQTIRLLMERSALYRRALAPIMLSGGRIGRGGGGGRIVLPLRLDAPRLACSGWARRRWSISGALLIARRQALKGWSHSGRRRPGGWPRRCLPPLTAGLVLGVCSPVAPAGGMVNFTILLPFFGPCFMAAPCTRRDSSCRAV